MTCCPSGAAGSSGYVRARLEMECPGPPPSYGGPVVFSVSGCGGGPPQPICPTVDIEILRVVAASAWFVFQVETNANVYTGPEYLTGGYVITGEGLADLNHVKDMFEKYPYSTWRMDIARGPGGYGVQSASFVPIKECDVDALIALFVDIYGMVDKPDVYLKVPGYARDRGFAPKGGWIA